MEGLFIIPSSYHNFSNNDFTVWGGVEELNVEEHMIAIGEMSPVRSQHDFSDVVSSHAHDHH